VQLKGLPAVAAQAPFQSDGAGGTLGRARAEYQLPVEEPL